MYRMTARNIAVISPMRQNFAALSKAGEFAEKIIAKYSGTESFPLNGEALVYFNALKNRLDEEKSLRNNIGYTLKLIIIHRLILDGKFSDPTITKQFKSSVSERIERNMSYLRISDNNAYTRLSEALTFIGKTENITENTLTHEITEAFRSYRFSSVDLTELEQKFFGELSNSYAYSGNHIYNLRNELVYRTESVYNDIPKVQTADNFVQELSENSGMAVNIDNDDYSYNSENLTYRTESVISEKNDITNEKSVLNEQVVLNIRNEHNKSEQRNESIFQNVGQSVGNVASEPVANVPAERYETANKAPETVINAGEVNYNYNNENTKYRTENVLQNNTDIRVEQNVRKSNVTGIPEIARTILYVDPDIIESTEIIPDNTPDEGRERYDYSSEELTYRIDSNDVGEAHIDRSAEVSVGNSVSSSVASISSAGPAAKAKKSEVAVNSSEATYENNEQSPKSRPSFGEALRSGFSRFFRSVRNIFRSDENDTVVLAESEISGEKQEKGTGTEDSGDNSNINSINYIDKTEVSEYRDSVVLQNVDKDEKNDDIVFVVPDVDENSVISVISTETTETVVNAGDENYSYNTENLTYKTENENSENGDVRNEKNIQIIRHISENNNISVSAPVIDVTTVNSKDTTNLITENVANTFTREIATVNPERVVNALNLENALITSETVVNTGDENYSYNTENLTYKTENENPENVEVRNEQNLQNIRNIRQTAGNNEIAVSAPVIDVTTVNNKDTTNINTENVVNTFTHEITTENPKTVVNTYNRENTTINTESVVNTSDENYSYNTENLTYKTENENSENVDVRNEQYAQNIRNIRQTAENNNIAVSAPVIDVTTVNNKVTTNINNENVVNTFTRETTTVNQETIVNTGDENYSYNTENLTYKTENENSENLDVRNEQYAQNIRNIRQTAENNNIAVSAPVTNVTTVNNEKKTTVNPETFANVVPESGKNEIIKSKQRHTLRKVLFAGIRRLFGFGKTDTQNVGSTGSASENKESTVIDLKTFIEEGGTEQTYSSENQTYTNVNNISENVDIRNEHTVIDLTNENNMQKFIADRQSSEDNTYVPADVLTEVIFGNAESEPEIIVNAGNENYSYSTENLTYKTETEVYGNTNTLNIENVPNVQKTNIVINDQNVLNETSGNITRETTDIRQLTESQISTMETGMTVISYETAEESQDAVLGVENYENPEIHTDSIVNAGDTLHSYNTENLTYKTETGLSENTDIFSEQIVEKSRNVGDNSVNQEAVPTKSAVTLKEAVAEKIAPELIKAGDLEKVSLLVMNTFLSGGTDYISSIKEKYLHKRISLTPVTAQMQSTAVYGLLNRPRSSFGTITYAIGLLVGNRDKDRSERELYESSVIEVYLQNHNTARGNVSEILSLMSPAEKTKVLSLVTERLTKGSVKDVNISTAANEVSGNGKSYITGSTSISPVRPVIGGTIRSKDYTNYSEKEKEDARYGFSGTWHLTPEAPAFTASEPEIRLLRLLSGDGYLRAVNFIAASEEDGTIASELKKLYFGIPYRISAERLLMNRVENAFYMPHPGMPQVDNIPRRNNTTLLHRYYTNTTYYSKEDNTEKVNVTQPHETINVSHDIINNAPEIMKNKKAEREESIPTTAGAPQIYALSAPSAAGRRYHRNTAEKTGALKNAKRNPGSTQETVRRILENIAKFEKITNTVTNRLSGARNTGSEKRSLTVLPDQTENIFSRDIGTLKYTTKEPIPEISAYSDRDSFTFNMSISEYDLPLVLSPRNTVSDNIRLLPVYALEGVILPRKIGKMPINVEKALRKKAAATADRTVIAHKKPMMLHRSERMFGKGNAAVITAGYEAAGAEGQIPASMLPMMEGTAEMKYRDSDTIPAEPYRPVHKPQLSQAELERRFGNLIEGSDAGLTYSMSFGKHGMDEAMATIEQTAEKVEANSKLIEEIREKQRAIESETLKSSDMDKISEDTIRKLRGRLRLDRSRFS